MLLTIATDIRHSPSVSRRVYSCSIPNQGTVAATRSITAAHARLWLVSVGSLLNLLVSHITRMLAPPRNGSR